MSETKLLEGDSAALLYDHLMELHGRLFAARRLEAAYHVLAAALHVAEELDDVERLSFIQRLAGNWQAEVDRALPVHPMSSGSAKRRGNAARFTTLALTAKAVTGRIHADRAVKRSRAGGYL
jgi:hypothetical protein